MAMAGMPQSKIGMNTPKQTTIFRSNFSDVRIPEQPLHEFVLERAGEFGDRACMVDGHDTEGHFIRFSQLRPMVKKVASSYTKMGLKKGEVFAIFSPNVPEYLIQFHAVLTCGGINTTVNPAYTVDELVHQLQDSKAKYLITVAAALDKAKEAAAKVPAVTQVYVFDGPAGDATSFSTLLESGDAEFVSDVTIDPKKDLACLPYSSGTTGVAKGVMLTHYNLVANICQITHPKLISLSYEDSLIAVLPFFHIYGMVVILNTAVRFGAKTTTMLKFDPTLFLQLLIKQKVTVAHVVPPLVNFLAKHPAVEPHVPALKENLRELFSGAAPLGEELAALAKKRLGGIFIRQGYGMTEMSPASHISPEGSAKLSSCGMVVPNTEVKLMDVKTREPVGVYSQGELVVRGPQIMVGYLNNDDATANCMDADGFMSTGDIAVMDEEGSFFIVDRLKELIKCKGFQVPPAEVEQKLHACPGVADAAVIGVADERDGEVAKAFVVRKGDDEGKAITEESVIAFCKEKMAEYKVPRSVVFVDAVPKSASGKILRRQLKEL